MEMSNKSIDATQRVHIEETWQLNCAMGSSPRAGALFPSRVFTEALKGLCCFYGVEGCSGVDFNSRRLDGLPWPAVASFCCLLLSASFYSRLSAEGRKVDLLDIVGIVDPTT